MFELQMPDSLLRVTSLVKRLDAEHFGLWKAALLK
jgi:hypothetical protein